MNKSIPVRGLVVNGLRVGQALGIGELAAMAQVSPKCVRIACRGGALSPRVVRRLALVLGVPVRRIVDGSRARGAAGRAVGAAAAAEAGGAGMGDQGTQ